MQFFTDFKRLCLWSFLLSLSIPAWSASLPFTVPTTREGGTSLNPSDIQSFRVLCGSESGNYDNDQVYLATDVLPASEVTDIEQMFIGRPDGDYYCVMTAIDTDGRESKFSTETVVGVSTSPPNPPTVPATIQVLR